LIEAFSTTCESCGGRGIHIHSEPVRKIALDKDMEQRYVPSSEREDIQEDEEEITNESANVAPDLTSPAPEASEPRGATPRKRRRAVSTGVITPV
jgi:ribonuclease E